MPTNTNTTLIKQLSDGGPDGTTVGLNASDPVSVYNKTPIAQQASNANAAPTQPAASTSTLLASVQSLANYAAVEIDLVKTILRNFGICT